MSHAYDHKRRVAVIGLSVFLLLAMVVAVFVGILTSDTDNPDEESLRETSYAKRVIEAFCRPTHYKKECESSLRSAQANQTDDPRQLAAEAFNQTREEMASALDRFPSLEPLVGNDTRGRYALEICHQVTKVSVGDLERAERSFDHFGNIADFDLFTQDLRVWTGGALTNLDVCLDSFNNATPKARDKMRELLLEPRELTANALAIVFEINKAWGEKLDEFKQEGQDTKHGNENENGNENANPPSKKEGHRRRLLAAETAGEVPDWMEDQKRNLMALPLADIKADVVVAKDGSGRAKTVREALHLVPKKSTKAFVIYVKEGFYDEHVTVNSKMTNIILIGDGPTKTVISGARSFADGWPIYMTGTIEIDGEGFMARDIGFENTAGPDKFQAVAARVSSDYSIFYNCRFAGFHNTLYALRSRQFYRDCTISGTIDFVSGDAVAIFQNCLLLLRAPLPGQDSVVTAQARADSNGPGATILQNCTITSEPGPSFALSKAFLGRPWKPYSRTIIMHSFIDKVIASEGWTPFSGKLGLDTLFYAEFMNKGPGSNLSGRVKWVGIKNLTIEQAGNFSAGKLFSGDDTWITNTGCPFYGHMLQTMKEP